MTTCRLRRTLSFSKAEKGTAFPAKGTSGGRPGCRKASGMFQEQEGAAHIELLGQGTRAMGCGRRSERARP